jgi:hypothetical protein
MVDRALFSGSWLYVGIAVLLALGIALLIPYVSRRLTRR